VVLEAVANAPSGLDSESPLECTLSNAACGVRVRGGWSGSPAVHAGDLLHVVGTVLQPGHVTSVGDNGAMNATYWIVSNGNQVAAPTPVSTGPFAASGEAYESRLIQFTCVHVVSGTSARWDEERERAENRVPSLHGCDHNTSRCSPPVMTRMTPRRQPRATKNATGNVIAAIRTQPRILAMVASS